MPNLLAIWQLIFCGLAWLVEDVHGLRREDLCIFSGALSVRYAATLLTFAHIHGPLSRGAIGTLKGLDGHFEQGPLVRQSRLATPDQFAAIILKGNPDGSISSALATSPASRRLRRQSS